MQFVHLMAAVAVSLSSLTTSLALAANNDPVADHDFYKTVCLWNATGQTVRARMQFEQLEPYSIELAPASYTSYSWYQREGTARTPALQLWFQKGLAADTLANGGAPDQTLVLINTEKERDCSKLRRFPLHYRVGEVWDLETGAVKGYRLTGPMLDP